MQSLFRRTRTQVHSPAAHERERANGLLSASHASAAIQLGAQLVLWIFFFGYDLCRQTIWQSLLMLLAPLLMLFGVWQHADVQKPSAKWWLLGLLFCLLLDASLLTASLSGFIAQTAPVFPAWTPVLLPSAVCWLGAWRARPRGVRYGSGILIVPLAALLAVGTVFLRASTRADRMWPILGGGLLSTAQGALNGAGAVWGAALFHLCGSGRAKAGWTLMPWALALLCAFWFAFVNPWAAGDALPAAEKMMGLARHAHSMILYEMSGILWMLLIPAALMSCLSVSGVLITRAFPALPHWAAMLPAAVLPAAACLWLSETLFSLLELLLPWRFLISLLCGLGLLAGKGRRA